MVLIGCVRKRQLLVIWCRLASLAAKKGCGGRVERISPVRQTVRGKVMINLGSHRRRVVHTIAGPVSSVLASAPWTRCVIGQRFAS